MPATTIKMKAILKSQFIFSPEDKEFLNSLPPNMPDTKLTKKQIDRVSSIYYKMIPKNQVFKGWGVELFEVEKKEKWPSGPRVKAHEAKRIILSNLLELNERGNMNAEQAASKFFYALTCRETYTILLQNVYELK